MKKIFFAAALAGAAMLASCGGNKGGVQLGSLSEFDSLSYSLGANIGYGMSYEMKDIPFDFKAVDKGGREGALGKATQEHDKSLDMLREYFMTKRGERAQAVAQKRAEADSVRLAGGDTTKVEYPAADPDMVESEDPDLDTCPLVGRDDVLLTPHSGYYSDTSNYLVAKLSMDNALYYVNGEYDKVKSIRNGVNA